MPSQNQSSNANTRYHVSINIPGDIPSFRVMGKSVAIVRRKYVEVFRLKKEKKIKSFLGVCYKNWLDVGGRRNSRRTRVVGGDTMMVIGSPAMTLLVTTLRGSFRFKLNQQIQKPV